MAPDRTADESASRTTMALRLADVLSRHGVSSGGARALSVGHWRSAAKVARAEWDMADEPAYVPSPATRAAVVAVLRHHERTARALPATARSEAR